MLSSLLLAVGLVSTTSAMATEPDAASAQAQALALRIMNRPANLGRIGEMHFTMRNKKGRERKRAAVLVYADEPETTKLAIHFTAPAAIRDTGFLSHNADAGPDQSWLYLPATDRVRRLPASDRGDYFMGTDLTYGDLQDNFKFDPADWVFTASQPVEREGVSYLALSGTALDASRKAMGYAGFNAEVDPNTLFPVRLAYTDSDGAPLKTLTIVRQEQIDGVWTATRFIIENLQTGHVTEVDLQNLRAAPDLDRSRLEASALDLGAPDLG